MFYITVGKHSEFKGCRATIDETTGKTVVWIDLEIGKMALDSEGVDGLINALYDARTSARDMERKHSEGGV